MLVDPEDGVCRSCGGRLEVIDADDATMTVEYTNCDDWKPGLIHGPARKCLARAELYLPSLNHDFLRLSREELIVRHTGNVWAWLSAMVHSITWCFDQIDGSTWSLSSLYAPFNDFLEQHAAFDSLLRRILHSSPAPADQLLFEVHDATTH